MGGCGDGGCVALAGGDGLLGGVERAPQRDGALALGGTEIGVAARHREAVRLADRRADLDAGRDVEVADDAAHDERLLGVLLAEEGNVRLHHVQQLGDDRRDAVEVAGALGAFERLRERTDGDGRLEAVGVDLLHRRGEQHVDAGLLGHLRVFRFVSRVSREVLGGGELGGVDEEGHHHDVRGLACSLHEGDVALVEGAHGGDEADGAAVLALCLQVLAQLFLGAEGPHAWAPTLLRAGPVAGTIDFAGGAARIDFPAPPARSAPLASALVASASASNSGRRSGVRCSIAWRWRSTVSWSPRAIGPVRACLGPRAAQFSTVAWTSGTRAARSTPAVAASCSAAASIVIRKLEAIEAAAW